MEACFIDGCSFPVSHYCSCEDPAILICVGHFSAHKENSHRQMLKPFFRSLEANEREAVLDSSRELLRATEIKVIEKKAEIEQERTTVADVLKEMDKKYLMSMKEAMSSSFEESLSLVSQIKNNSPDLIRDKKTVENQMKEIDRKYELSLRTIKDSYLEIKCIFNHLLTKGFPAIPMNEIHRLQDLKDSNLADHINLILFEKGFFSIRIADSIWNIGKNSIETNPEYSIRLLNSSLNIVQKLLTNDQIRIGNIYNELGRVYAITNKLEEAEKSVALARSIGESIQDGKIIVRSEYTAGYIKFKQNDINGAIKLFEKNLKMRIELFGEYDLDVAKTYDALAVIHERKKNQKTSKKYKEKYFEIKLNLCSPNTIEYYKTMKEMVESYLRYKDNKNANSVNIKLGQIINKIEDFDDRMKYQAYMEVASRAKEARDWANAEIYYQRALNMTEIEDDTTLKIYSDMIEIYKKLNNKNKAEHYRNLYVRLNERLDPHGLEVIRAITGINYFR